MTNLQLSYAPNESLESYLSWSYAQPNLSQQEESLLLKSYKEENDINAAQKLIISHLKYVAFIARSYVKFGMNLADLIQEGNIGLMKALRKFDISQPVRLVTYATHWIKAEIQDFIVKNLHMVKRLTTHTKKKVWQMLSSSKPSNQEISNIAEETGISKREVEQIAHTLTTDHYLEESLTSDNENTRHIDVLPSNAPSPEQDIITLQSAEHDLQNIQIALTKLSDKERHIILKRWPQCTSEKAKLKDIAANLDISIERVRQIEKSALLKMRKIINSTNNSC